jgi:RNA polymerase sigma factor (TIGR02999 family)
MTEVGSRQEQIALLLAASQAGDREALDRLVPLVYDEMRQIAHRQLRGERNRHTLNTTALVHEAYAKLARLDRIQWQGRAHFLALAAQAMRQILVNYAVQQRAAKRGGNARPESLSDLTVESADGSTEDLLNLDEALKRLAVLNERHSRIVEYRFFGGMTVEETAEVLGISPATVKRDWHMARAWLNRELG